MISAPLGTTVDSVLTRVLVAGRIVGPTTDPYVNPVQNPPVIDLFYPSVE